MYPFQLRGENFLKITNLNKNLKEKSIGSKDMNEKERLFDLLIHDLTGPLSIVSASTTILLRKGERYGPLTDHQRRTLERILRNARKAQTLLQEMIEIFHLEEGLFQKESFSIEKALMESFLDALEMTAPPLAERLRHMRSGEEFHNLLETAGIFVKITGKYCQSTFCHDQKKVQQILRNLINNALKYRRKRMDVSISGETELLVLVEDDGIGIPAEEQEAIFERFVRLNDEKRPHVLGFGLGLTGVKALVEAMQGEITLRSREGFGTCFTVRIPPLQS